MLNGRMEVHEGVAASKCRIWPLDTIGLLDQRHLETWWLVSAQDGEAIVQSKSGNLQGDVHTCAPTWLDVLVERNMKELQIT